MCFMSDLQKPLFRLLKMICIVVGLAMPIETLSAQAINYISNPNTISGINFVPAKGFHTETQKVRNTKCN